jgi:PST family polysaccharide transporter
MTMSSGFDSIRFGKWWRTPAGSGWLLVDRFVRMGLGFILSAVLARMLGPAVYGTFIYATTLATLFLPLVSLGLERIVIRDLARSIDQRPALLGAGGALRFLGGFLSSTLAIAVAWLLGTGDPRLRLIVAVIASGNVFMAADVVDWAFQADARFRVPVIARLIGFILSTVAKLLLAWKAASIVWLAVAVFGEMAFTGILLLFLARKIPGASLGSWLFHRDMAVRLLISSWPLLLAEVAVGIFQRFDLVILNHFANKVEVGYYAVASKLAQASFFLPTIAVQVFSPLAARATDARAVLALTTRIMTVLTSAGLAISVVLCAGSPWLIPLLFGRTYLPSIPLLAILSWTNVFAFMGCCHGLYLVTINQQWISLRLTWITALCSLCLNLALIPRWHATGAAAAAAGAMGLTTLFGVALFRESRPLFFLNFRAMAAPFRLLAKYTLKSPAR